MTDKKEEKKYPEPVVGALIRNKENKFLLAKSEKWSGRYTIPGGHIEIGETIEETVKREVKEEMGIDVEVLAALRVGEGIHLEEYKKDKHLIFLNFLCEYKGESDKVKLNNEFQGEAKWVTFDEAQKSDLTRGVKEIFQKYKEYQESQNNLDGWKRCQADFENYKKRQAETQKEFIKFSCRNIVMEILPILDNFHASTDHVPEEQKDQPWVTGIMHIQKQLEDMLKNYGVTEIETKVGDEFSPEIHEAITQNPKPITHNLQPKAQNLENKITKIVQRGYKIDGKVIRPGRVIVE